MNQWIYIVGVTDNPVKVGRAFAVEERVKSMQIGCPDELKIFSRYEVPRYAATELEGAIHDALRPHHRHGEWFNVSAAEAERTIFDVAPAVLARAQYNVVKDGDWLVRLEGAYLLDNWVREALVEYRVIRGDRKRRQELDRIHAEIASRAGVGSFAAFKTVVTHEGSLEQTLNRSSAAIFEAQSGLVKALNVLAEMTRKRRENALLDILQESAA